MSLSKFFYKHDFIALAIMIITISTSTVIFIKYYVEKEINNSKIIEEKFSFFPQDCKIVYKDNKYKLLAKSKEIEQKYRLIGGTDTIEAAEQLAKTMGCQRLKKTTGGWYDINN